MNEGSEKAVRIINLCANGAVWVCIAAIIVYMLVGSAFPRAVGFVVMGLLAVAAVAGFITRIIRQKWDIALAENESSGKRLKTYFIMKDAADIFLWAGVGVMLAANISGETAGNRGPLSTLSIVFVGICLVLLIMSEIYRKNER